MTIKVVPLGAGQDVGRSCILVCMGGKNIMFDAGIRPGMRSRPLVDAPDRYACRVR